MCEVLSFCNSFFLFFFLFFLNHFCLGEKEPLVRVLVAIKNSSKATATTVVISVGFLCLPN